MFTGLVKEIGLVETIERSAEGARIELSGACVAELGGGDSLAVDGCCLTAERVSGERFFAFVMNQTLSLTTLGELEPGDRVNLEPALRAGEPLGGHLVQGHVDGVATVAFAGEDGGSLRLEVDLPAQLERFTVEHGSITLAGASLTVASLTDRGIEVALIPETRSQTTLGEAGEGSRLNVEVDVLARYVERFMSAFSKEPPRR